MDMVELAQNFFLVCGVASLPIIAWFGLLAYAKRTSEAQDRRRMHAAE